MSDSGILQFFVPDSILPEEQVREEIHTIIPPAGVPWANALLQDVENYFDLDHIAKNLFSLGSEKRNIVGVAHINNQTLAEKCVLCLAAYALFEERQPVVIITNQFSNSYYESFFKNPFFGNGVEARYIDLGPTSFQIPCTQMESLTFIEHKNLKEMFKLNGTAPSKEMTKYIFELSNNIIIDLPEISILKNDYHFFNHFTSFLTKISILADVVNEKEILIQNTIEYYLQKKIQVSGLILPPNRNKK